MGSFDTNLPPEPSLIYQLPNRHLHLQAHFVFHVLDTFIIECCICSSNLTWSCVPHFIESQCLLHHYSRKKSDHHCPWFFFFTSLSPYLKSVTSFLNVSWISLPFTFLLALSLSPISCLTVTTVYYWPPQHHSFMPRAILLTIVKANSLKHKTGHIKTFKISTVFKMYCKLHNIPKKIWTLLSLLPVHLTPLLQPGAVTTCPHTPHIQSC